MTRSRRSIFVALFALLAVGPALVFAKGGQPEKTEGGYKVAIRGNCSGTGSATVHGGNGGGNVTVTAEVTDDKGNKGVFEAKLQLKGAHFKGEGKAMGRTVTITGRLDGYASKKGGPGKGKGKAFQKETARLLGSYTDEKNPAFSGRIAGVINSHAPSEPNP